jgi:hypothetical protein
MSNRRYYARRAASVCPECGRPVAAGVYCAADRAKYRARADARRARDVEASNRYQREYYHIRKRRILHGC